MKRQQINLYQDQLIDKPQPLQARQAALLLLAILFVLGLLCGHRYWVATGLEKQLEELQQQQQIASARVVELEKKYPELHENALLKEELQRLEKKIEGQKQALEYFSKQENNNRTIFSSLKGLAQMSPQGLWLHQVQLLGGGEQVLLAGSALQADQVPVYLQLIGDKKIFGGKVFAQLEIKRVQEQDGHVNFILESDLEKK